MTEFIYDNAKNASINHIFPKLNCDYHLHVFLKHDVDSRSGSKSTEKLSNELEELIVICQENLYYAYGLQKQAYDKDIKPGSYVPCNEIWLNSKYLKTKRN